MCKLLIILSMCFLLSPNVSQAQITGCTDPLAKNYAPSATQNDGSCLYDAESVEPLLNFNLSGLLAETSGLIEWNNLIWTHNDDSDTNIYSLDTASGRILGTYPMSGVINNDWEEISQDSDYIYIGDFGNNSSGNRTNMKILRIEKNSMLANAPIIDTINFSYSDQNDFTATQANKTDFDCEAFIVANDSIYLFTKQWISNKTSLYSLPKVPGTYKANLISILDVQGLITGAVCLESQRLTLLCGYTNLLQPFIYLLYDYSDSYFFGGNKRRITISLPFHQVEGIASNNGLKFYISNENFVKSPFINNPQKLHILDLSPFLEKYLKGLKVCVPVKKPDNTAFIFPNPTTDLVTISTKVLPASYILTNQLGEVVYTGELTQENPGISVAGLSAGMYILSIGDNRKIISKLYKQ